MDGCLVPYKDRVTTLKETFPARLSQLRQSAPAQTFRETQVFS
jgi:hypothetical protein